MSTIDNDRSSSDLKKYMKLESKVNNITEIISPIKIPMTNVLLSCDSLEYSSIEKTSSSKVQSKFSTKSSFVRQKSFKSCGNPSKVNDVQIFPPKNATIETQPLSYNNNEEEKKKAKIKLLIKKHKKTLSNFNSNPNFNINKKILGYKVDDEYYKKLLFVDPLQNLKKESERSSLANAISSTKFKKHLKQASYNNDFFFKNKISFILNNAKTNRNAKSNSINNTHSKNKSDKTKIGDKNSSSTKIKEVNVVEPMSKADKELIKVKKTISNKLQVTKLDNLRCETDVREETEEDEVINTLRSNPNENEPQMIIPFSKAKTNIFDELTKNNRDLEGLMNFSYNKINSSNLTEENSMLNFSINTDLYANKKQQVDKENYVRFDHNDDYLKKIVFNN